MQRQETVIIAIKKPTVCKADFLNTMAHGFSDAVQIGLNMAQKMHTSDRNRIHHASYYAIRAETKLPSDYARVAIAQVVALVRSYYGLQKSKHQKHTSFPTVNKTNNIGLGVNAYAIIKRDNNFVLRVSTGKRGHYIWLPLSVPAKFQDKMQYVYGDAKMFRRNKKWFVVLPLRISHIPTVCDGEPAFIGVDLGIVRIATISTPDGVIIFDGKAIRHRREHFADIRRRYQKANRLDKIKFMHGKESRWMSNMNHVISKHIVEIALQYKNPIIVFERLDGIRDRIYASKRFNRMLNSWAFRQLTDFVEYKAKRHDIPVLFIDPRQTSRTCPRCGHATRSNRPSQSQFRCVKCGFQDNCDSIASANIAGGGARLHHQGLSDNALSDNSDKTRTVGFWPDGVHDRRASRLDPNLSSSL